MENLGLNKNFWRGKKVFITGHTGFKGSWLTQILKNSGADITGYSTKPITTPALFDVLNIKEDIHSIIADIRDRDCLAKSIRDVSPQIILHLAAQPLVRYSYENPVETYDVNFTGTLNLLEAIKKTSSVSSVLIVTTDKCYENDARDMAYMEHDRLGGYDPYSNSKACVEMITHTYRKSFFNDLGMASARAGNVIGGGDWSDDRLLPDIVRAFVADESVEIRMPGSVRPWQHVLDVLYGYLRLVENLEQEPKEYSGAWNFGPADTDTKTVEWIVQEAVNCWGETASWTLSKDQHPHEAGYLSLNSDKARQRLSWKTYLELKQALRWTISWYKQYYSSNDMLEYTNNQLQQYAGLQGSG